MCDATAQLQQVSWGIGDADLDALFKADRRQAKPLKSLLVRVGRVWFVSSFSNCWIYLLFLSSQRKTVVHRTTKNVRDSNLQTNDEWISCFLVFLHFKHFKYYCKVVTHPEFVGLQFWNWQTLFSRATSLNYSSAVLFWFASFASELVWTILRICGISKVWPWRPWHPWDLHYSWQSFHLWLEK